MKYKRYICTKDNIVIGTATVGFSASEYYRYNSCPLRKGQVIKEESRSFKNRVNPVFTLNPNINEYDFFHLKKNDFEQHIKDKSLLEY